MTDEEPFPGSPDDHMQRLERLTADLSCCSEQLDKADAENDALHAQIATLTAALRYGTGAAINELTARNLPKEWSPKGSIGIMLTALGCNSTSYDDECRAALEAKKFPAGEPPVGDQANAAPIKGDKNAEETPTINRTHFRSVDGF